MTDPSDASSPSRIWVRSVVGSVLVIGCVIGILAGIAYAKVSQIRAAMSEPPPPEMPVSVSLATAQPSVFRQSTVVVGTVLASQSIVLQTELSGLVTEVAMRPGDRVARGDVLVRLDDRTEQAQLRSAIAARDLARSSLKRVERLADANAGSELDLDVAEAEWIRADTVVDQWEVLIDRKTLRAPFDARVGLFDLHVGQYLVEGSRITSLEGLADFFHVDFAMPAHVADRVRIGDEVQIVTDPVSTPRRAKIIAQDAAADRVSRSVMARAKLQEPPANLQPGDSVRVTVFYGDEISACLVPSTAVRRGPTGTTVYVAEQREGMLRAIPQNVLVAGTIGPMSRVVDGLSSGQRVITDGSFKVFEGSLIAEANRSNKTPSNDASNSNESTNSNESNAGEMDAETANGVGTTSAQGIVKPDGGHLDSDPAGIQP